MAAYRYGSSQRTRGVRLGRVGGRSWRQRGRWRAGFATSPFPVFGLGRGLRDERRSAQFAIGRSSANGVLRAFPPSGARKETTPGCPNYLKLTFDLDSQVRGGGSRVVQTTWAGRTRARAVWTCGNNALRPRRDRRSVVLKKCTKCMKLRVSLYFLSVKCQTCARVSMGGGVSHAAGQLPICCATRPQERAPAAHHRK